MEQWPEGAAADPKAARRRYDSGMKASREALREVVRADLHRRMGELVLGARACLLDQAWAGSGSGLDPGNPVSPATRASLR